MLYNPLFIYGGVGLGKTHLMHAIGNQLLADKPGSKVLYIHAEQFVTDVVKSYQKTLRSSGTLPLARPVADRRRAVLRQQKHPEEFFNAFEALLAKKAIVMTSDTYPKAGRHPRTAGVALRLPG